MPQYIYLRVSTTGQDLDSQAGDVIKRFPSAEIVREIASGAKDRPVLEELIKSLKKGDTLIVAALDRLGRKAAEVIPLLDKMYKSGINIISIRESLDYATPMGKFVAQLLASFAEMERNLISERVKSSLRSKKDQGIKLGRKQVFECTEEVLRMREKGYSLRDIAGKTGMSKSNVAKVLASRKEIP
jgi:DNA invertase Pin-like site-specific DNA recombinase